MTKEQAQAESCKLMDIVFEYAAKQGGLWTWLKDTDITLYRALVTIQRNYTKTPSTTTLIRALDAAGYKLEVVPQDIVLHMEPVGRARK